jgi:hypothetical protein
LILETNSFQVLRFCKLKFETFLSVAVCRARIRLKVQPLRPTEQVGVPVGNGQWFRQKVTVYVSKYSTTTCGLPCLRWTNELVLALLREYVVCGGYFAFAAFFKARFRMASCILLLIPAIKLPSRPPTKTATYPKNHS